MKKIEEIAEQMFDEQIDEGRDPIIIFFDEPTLDRFKKESGNNHLTYPMYGDVMLLLCEKRGYNITYHSTDDAKCFEIRPEKPFDWREKGA